MQFTAPIFLKMGFWNANTSSIFCKENENENFIRLITGLFNRINSIDNDMDKPSHCFKCKKTPDDILMLECSHDICLLCAGELLNQSKQKENDKNFACLCGVITELDLSAVYEIEKVMLQNQRHKRSSSGYKSANRKSMTIEQPTINNFHSK